MNISAVIPTYNSAAYIRTAIDSVLAQTHTIQEIVVVDDGSTDDTRRVVEGYGPPVRYIYQQNQGVSAARNRGIAEASHPWIAFLDADDWWFPEKTAQQKRALEEDPGAVLAFCSVWFVEPGGARYVMEVKDADRLWPMLRCSNRIATSSVVVQREAVLQVGGFNESLSHCEDWDLWVRLRARNEFTCVQEPLIAYRTTPSSLTADIDRMLASSDRILDSTLLAGLGRWDRVMWRRRIRSAQYHGAAITAREARSPRERALLWRSVCQWPFPSFLPTRWLDIAQNLIGPQRYGRISKSLKHLGRQEQSRPARLKKEL